ncbi:transposase [Streptomyces sp. NPDC055037]
MSEAARTLLALHPTKLTRRLTQKQALRRAQLLIKRSGLLPAVEAVLHHQVGKPREFTARALLTGLAVHAMLLEEMHLTRVLDTLAGLPLTARRNLGLTDEPSYRMLWHAYTLLTRALDAGTLATPHNHPLRRASSEEEPVSCPDECPYEPISISEFTGRLLDASLPEGLPLSGVIAIDSTDYETWARRRAWTPEPDIAPDHVPVPAPAPFEDAPPPSRKRPPNEPGWPCTGADGRLVHTADPDAREGYRSGTNASPGNVFCGFDLHLAVNARALGARAPEVPFVFTAMHLAAAGSHKGDAGIALIDQHLARHPHTSEVIADRGYSYCTPAQWAHPVRARGLEPVIDLHPKQRGTHPGPLPGTLIIDGTVFTDALPRPLRDLPGFLIGMRSAEKAKLRARYDQRATHAFTPHSRPDTDGYQRFKGPALAGHLRCPNHPRSMRLPHTRPTSTCRPDTDCACGKTVTLSPDIMAWTRQRTIWGTTAWAADYGRRAAVESGNAEIKTHRLHMDRGFTRVLGTTKNSVLIAFALAGLNHTLLRAWHTKRQLPDPWATFAGEETIKPAAPGPRTRARRRATSLTALIDGAPPG